MFFLSKLCVLCLNTCKTIESVSSEKSEKILLQKKLKCCLPEIIDSHSAIPKYVCSNCMNKLECFYKFKQICLQNDTYLKSYFQTLISAGESYQYLSIKLPDIKYQNKLQTLNIEHTISTVGNDEALRTGEKENNGIYIKEEVVKNEAQCVDGLDIEESHLLCETENNTGIKEEFFISEDNAGIEFYNEYDKSIIKCESISSNSDASVSEIKDSKYANSNSKTNELPEPAAKNKIRKIQKFQCAICSKEYSRKILLNYHLKLHSGIKDYICSICGNKFMQKCHLTRHEQIHTGVKKYECAICKQMFMQKCDLVRHKKIHTGIKNCECTICKKKFIDKYNLAKHKKNHLGIKNYECVTCRKKFMQKYNLVQHEKIHVGIKNNECSICKKKFLLKSHLVKHEKIHVVIKN